MTTLDIVLYRRLEEVALQTLFTSAVNFLGTTETLTLKLQFVIFRCKTNCESDYLHLCTVHFVVYLINTPTNAHI